MKKCMSHCYDEPVEECEETCTEYCTEYCAEKEMDEYRERLADIHFALTDTPF